MGVRNMKYFIKGMEKNKNDLISIVKLASLVLCLIAFYSEFLMKNIITVKGYKNSYYDIMQSSALVIVMIFIYLFWLVVSVNIFKIKYIRVLKIFESTAFISIISILIIFSNAYVSQYKFLFIFIIITSTLQSGMKYGMITALISSTIIFYVDLIYIRGIVINTYFQNDLTLVGVFVVIAWTLGRYVKIENENLRKKNMQLEELNNELNKRKSIEEMLITNRTCYNTLIENSRDAIFVQREGSFIFANEGAVKFLGFNNTEELNGKSILDFTPEEDKKSILEKFKVINSHEESMLTFEGRVVNNTGKVIDINNTSIYFIYNGEPTILSIFSDVTPEKQVKKLEINVKENMELLNETREMNKMITEFFSNVSHELKTPLHVIFSAIQLLSLYSENCEEGAYCNIQEKYLAVMKTNCYRLMRLINNILDMTILDAGFFRLSIKNYNIVSVVEDISMSVASYAESKNIGFVFDTEVEEVIMAFDPDKIERIMLNLISNAIKFSKPGGEIDINIIEEGKHVCISVKDNGTGIPEDKLTTIFERFEQVDKTFRRNCEGAGIGLSLVKSLVEMHKGTIEVSSKLGQGSEFVIKLPVIILENEGCEEYYNREANIELINLELSDIYSDSISKKQIEKM